MKNNYIYYNASPNGQRRNDCVVRALSLALDLDYFDVEDLLVEIGDYYDCEELCVECYSYLLNAIIGLKTYDGMGKTVGETAREHPNSVLLIRVEGHLTVSINSAIYDTFDCTNEICDRYWIVERY